MGIMGEICRRGRQERNGKGTTGEREGTVKWDNA